jgi:chromosome partitioning protein
VVCYRLDIRLGFQRVASQYLPGLVKPGALSFWRDNQMIITLLNQKGGVGKTTSTFAIGAALTEIGRRVLMIDLDPQGSLTTACGINPDDLELTIHTYMRRVMQDTDAAPLTLDELDAGIRVLDGIRSTGCLHLLPANIELSAAELDLVNAMSRERILAEALQPVITEYDDILIDCLPSLGLLAINALAASDGVLVPHDRASTTQAQPPPAHPGHPPHHGRCPYTP